MAPGLARKLPPPRRLGLVVGLVGCLSAVLAVAAGRSLLPAAPAARSGPVVFVGCGLAEEDLVPVTAAVFASRPAGTLLLASPGVRPYLKNYMASFQPARVIPVGRELEKEDEVTTLLGMPAEPVLRVGDGPPTALWEALFRHPKRVVVCPGEPRRLLLQAACLAGVLEAPLYVLRGKFGEDAQLRRQLAAWRAREVFVVLGAAGHLIDLPGVRLIKLADESKVAACYLRHQLARGPVDTLVVANPADGQKKLGNMSALAPWVALQKRAALLLTNDAGDNTRALVEQALRSRALRRVESLFLLASLEAIPVERRPNPVPGKDALIEMEPMTPTGWQPFTFATGRLFNADLGFVLLALARQSLLAQKSQPPRALVVSNPAGGLPLLETFSRNTAKELGNCGFATRGLFGSEVSRDGVRHLLPEQDIFLWEGHHSTMARDYGLPGWPEPLRPSLVFLQSCLALCEAEAQPLLQRGAVGVIGTSTRTYSASGGACALAFFNALLYDGQSVGGALRQAKNFLVAYALLKEKRLGAGAKLQGANLRSAWAFSLWGDPTMRLTLPEPPAAAIPPVTCEVQGRTIVLRGAADTYEKVASERYRARMPPNGRMAGLVRKQAMAPERLLVPFLFAEIRFPRVPAGKFPQLRSAVPRDRWVFNWDRRRQSGYLLVEPRARDRAEARFHVDWESSEHEAVATGNDE